jgi:hypothetical protein
MPVGGPRVIASVLALVLVLGACTSERKPFEGFRDLEEGQVIAYRVVVNQKRVASGLGPRKELRSKVRLDLEEEATSKDSYALVVRDHGASGEKSQKLAAQRLVGRRLNVDLDDGVFGGDEQAFSGTDDVAASDIGMLFTLFAPLLPSPRPETGDEWRYATRPVRVPWSETPLTLTVTHEVVGPTDDFTLGGYRVSSVALGNVSFELPLVVPAEPGKTPEGPDDLIVNQLFESLFADVDNPIEGFAATIAAIPLAILAPFLAIGEAFGSLFGGSDDEPDDPQVPSIDLSGPLELKSDTNVWDGDGRVLSARGSGTMQLTGTVPELPGRAAELSGKTLHLDVSWKLTRTHTSKLPEPRDPPGPGLVGIVAVVLLLVAAALNAWNHAAARRRRSGLLRAAA